MNKLLLTNTEATVKKRLLRRQPVMHRTGAGRQRSPDKCQLNKALTSEQLPTE